MIELSVRTAVLAGVKATPAHVMMAVSKKPGPSIDISGVPETSAREIRIRVVGALKVLELDTSGLSIEVGVAGFEHNSTTHLDLPIALGVVAILRNEPEALQNWFVAGELSLYGKVRPVRGVLAMLHAVPTRALIPRGNVAECSYLESVNATSVETLEQAIAHVFDHPKEVRPPMPRPHINMSDVIGHTEAIRALTVAAAANTNVLLVGAPGGGKTMLARRFTTILPVPTEREQMEMAIIHSVAGLSVTRPMPRPFRAPHHTASSAALAGGGKIVRPGELTLAHRGVLLLDELPEFRRDAIDAVVGALDKGIVVVPRIHQRVVMPARPLVIGSMNPCPCGWRGDETRICNCTPARVDAYHRRVDSIARWLPIRVNVPRVKQQRRKLDNMGPDSLDLQHRVTLAREEVDRRPSGSSVEDFRKAGLKVLDNVEGLSAINYVQLLRVARTCAVLDCESTIQPHHVEEAIALVHRPHGEEVGGS